MANYPGSRWLTPGILLLLCTLTAIAKPHPKPAPAAPAATPTPTPPATTPAPSQSPPPVPAGTYQSLVDILKKVPSGSFRKLEDASTLEAGITEINSYLAANAIGKPAQFRLRIAVAKPLTETKNKFRVRMVDHPVLTWSGGQIIGRLWAYFPADAVPADGKAAVGNEILVSGVIGRCDINNKDQLLLNVDLQEAKLVNP